MFNIYNKSSEDMSEIKDNIINLIVTSPPFNLGTEYNEFKDDLSNKKYFKILGNVISECFRVLAEDGIFVIEVSDTLFINGVYLEFAGFVQSLCLRTGFSLRQRNFNFALTKDYVELPDHGWNLDYTTKSNAHSNLNQILVFSKSKSKFDRSCDVTYSSYKPSDVHPCPFPKDHIDLFLKNYFKTGFNVLDPFMGTGELGVEVLKRDGNFFGYDLVSEYCKKARSNLEALNKN